MRAALLGMSTATKECLLILWGCCGMIAGMVRRGVISAGFWEAVEPLLPAGGGRGRPWADYRTVLKVIS